MSRRRRGAVALAGGPVLLVCPVLLACLVAAGCGVPVRGTTAVPATSVPRGLLDPAPSSGSGTGAADGPASSPDDAVAAPGLDGRPPTTYLLDAEDMLTPVVLDPAPAAGPLGGEPDAPAVTAVLLRRLAAGPTASQRDAGLSTALGPGVPVVLVDVVGTTARVALRQPDRDPSADRLPLAAGQVVLTVTSAPGVDRVQMLRDGEPTAVPLPGGVRSSGPVTADDYAALTAPTR